MKVNSVFVAFAIIGFAAVWAAEGKPGTPGFSCTPGEYFMDDCNTCICADNGKLAGCTLMRCLPKPQVRALPSFGEPHLNCTPGETFKLDCNTCVCGHDGHLAICTLMGCPEFRENHVTEDKDLKQKCTPGEFFMDKCNSCICSNDGNMAACTRMNCLPVPIHTQRSLEPSIFPTFKCTPGEHFKHDCNSCFCGNDGKVALCTLMRCPSTFPPKIPATNQVKVEECTDGEIQMRECNRCVCAQNEWGCTRRACPPELKDLLEGKVVEPTCTTGEVKMHECNRCVCGNGEWMCTKRGCPKALKEFLATSTEKPSPICQSGDKQMQDCNFCRCIGEDWACTRMACPKIPALNKEAQNEISGEETPTKAKRDVSNESVSSSEEDVKCKVEGQEKKIDCNECVCENGEWTCGRMLCPPKKSKRDAATVPACTDGEFQKQDCNNCQCIQGEWACTKKRCVPGLANAARERREEPVEKEFKGTSCAPNDEFKIDCNTCYCNHDGSGYSCTEKSCAETVLSTDKT